MQENRQSFQQDQRALTKYILSHLDHTYFCLAGSGSLREHGVINRATRDIDIFFSYSSPYNLPDVFNKMVKPALETAGYVIKNVRSSSDSIIVCLVKSPAGYQHEIDICKDYLTMPFPITEIGPVRTFNDSIVSKLQTFESRMEERDASDVAHILRYVGKSRWVWLINLSKEYDSGFLARNLLFASKQALNKNRGLNFLQTWEVLILEDLVNSLTEGLINRLDAW